MNLSVKVDKNGSLYVCDKEGKMFNNVESIVAKTVQNCGAFETTYTIEIADIFSKIEPLDGEWNTTTNQGN